MNFTGILIGAVLGMWLTHNLLGALIGGAIGFMFDASRQQSQRRRAPEQGGYIVPLFALIGAVAKADGRVSEAEIAIAERLMVRMNLDQDDRARAIDAFNQGKQPEFNATEVIDDLRQWVGHRRDHAFPVIDVVIETVLAEGTPSPEKMAILRQLAFALRVSDMELMALMAMKGYAWNGNAGQGRAYGGGGGRGGYVPPQRNTQGPDPYAVLGIQRDTDERAIKRAYRKLISEHHPDRLGDLPEDMRRRAEARASEINAAYERIKAERGFK
jgi:DnaJ like chaperone protein